MTLPLLRRRPPIPQESDFTSRLRSPAVASRVGLWLGICFGIAFVTGLISHAAQSNDLWFPFPSHPAWGYRVTQGLHVISGTAAIPLLVVKLWSVFPKLFARVPRAPKELVLTSLERGSIALLVSGSIFLLASGLANSAQWYPWSFRFRDTHYAVAWITIGALITHVMVKLPLIRRALGADVEDTSNDRPSAVDSGGLSRRGLLRTTWVAAGGAVLLSAGATIPWLRKVSVFAVRSGDGPGGIPINHSAKARDVIAAALSPDYRLTVTHTGRTLTFSRAQLAAMPQHTYDLPIACVEGWSASGAWTGVRVRDLLARVGAAPGRDVEVFSLQPRGGYRRTTLPANFADNPSTLIALQLNDEPLSIDHGYPCRLIAPNRPGVLQTKWVARLEA
jgi:hypothetical protein